MKVQLHIKTIFVGQNCSHRIDGSEVMSNLHMTIPTGSKRERLFPSACANITTLKSWPV